MHFVAAIFFYNCIFLEYISTYQSLHIRFMFHWCEKSGMELCQSFAIEMDFGLTGLEVFSSFKYSYCK